MDTAAPLIPVIINKTDGDIAELRVVSYFPQGHFACITGASAQQLRVSSISLTNPRTPLTVSSKTIQSMTNTEREYPSNRNTMVMSTTPRTLLRVTAFTMLMTSGTPM